MKKYLFAALAFLAALAVETAEATTIYTTESAVALAGAATFTGSAHDLGASPVASFSYVGCAAVTDQTGNLYLDVSTDGVTWKQAATGALAANVVTDLNARIRSRYYRCREINGATPQTNNLVLFGATEN